MGKLEIRVAALESTGGRSAYEYPWHEIVLLEGLTDEAAVDAYGRHRIGPNDNLIINRVVAPKRDDNGNLIRQEYLPEKVRTHLGHGGFGGLEQRGTEHA